MSSNNNNNGEAMGFAFILAGLAMVGFFLFAVAAFFALILSVLCLIAWNNPLTIGKMTITPEEARIFIYSGVAGSILLPVFAVFCCILFHVGFNDDYWSYLFLGGYVAGSLGVSYHMAQQAEAEAANQMILPPQIPAPPQKSVPRTSSEEFRFASWDDEEGRE